MRNRNRNSQHNLMKSAERALGSHVTIFVKLHSYACLSSWPSNEMCSKEIIASTCVIHLTACTVWQWIDNEFVLSGMCQVFRLDFIFWLL